MIRHLKRSIVAVLGILASVSIFAAMPAVADGISPKTNGCYAYWNRTVVYASCQNTTQSGSYRMTATCDWEPGYVGHWVYIAKNATVLQWDRNECTFFATGGSIQYTG